MNRWSAGGIALSSVPSRYQHRSVSGLEADATVVAAGTRHLAERGRQKPSIGSRR